MKKIMIGCSVLLAGIIDVLGIIITAAIYLPHMNAWSTAYPSKLMFLIFAGNSRFNDGADGMGLGIFFVAGIIMVIVGLLILGREYMLEMKKR